MKCKEYVGVACVNDTCPKANRDEYIERDISVIDDCGDCHFNHGCKDCVLIDTCIVTKIIRRFNFLSGEIDC